MVSLSFAAFTASGSVEYVFSPIWAASLSAPSATAFPTELDSSAASALIGIMVSATASDKIMEKILFVRKLFLVNFFLLPWFVSMSSNLPCSQVFSLLYEMLRHQPKLLCRGFRLASAAYPPAW